jgi:AbrB family looped-hinge helix DNA binding protein
MYARTVKMTGKGQIVVPKEMRDSLGLKRDSTILLIQKDEDILMKKPDSIRGMLEDFPELRAATERIFGEVWKDEDDKLWESYIKD